MDYDISEKESALRDEVAKIIADDGMPDPDGVDPGNTQEVEACLRAWLQRLGAAGHLSAALGRKGASEALSLVLAIKTLAVRSQWLALAVEIGARRLASLIADHGSEDVRQGYFDRIVSGESITAVAVSEPKSGSVPAELSTVAEPQGQGWVVNGEKVLVSLAPMADVIAVAAQTRDGTALFMVEKAAAGLTIGERVTTLGYEELQTSNLKLEAVSVDAGQVIGPLGEGGEDLLHKLRRIEDRSLTAISLGIIGCCLEEAKKAADVERNAAKPPAGHQLVRFTLAEMLALSQTADLLAYRAACLEERDVREARSLALCAKVFATETALRISDQALQVMAASAYSGRNRVERAFRNARLGTIVAHTSQVARMAIAEDVLDTLVR